MRTKEEYASMISWTDKNQYRIVEAISPIAYRRMEKDAEEITSSLDFRAAEIARERYERAKEYHMYNELRHNAHLAQILYHKCYTKIRATYGHALPMKDNAIIFDITPLGVLLEEIEFAMKTLSSI